MQEYTFISELFDKRSGRYKVSLRKNGQYIRIPRANWNYMLGTNKEIDKGLIIHHIDKNKINDVGENLLAVTRIEHNKLHAEDKNHYMFRKGHTYWNKPKSEEHKLKIKSSHINRALFIREQILRIAQYYIKEDMTQKQFLNIIGRKSHHSIYRITGMNFTELKKFILGI